MTRQELIKHWREATSKQFQWAINRLVDNRHVATPFEEIELQLRESDAWPHLRKNVQRGILTLARKRHEANYRFYCQVQRGVR